MTPSPIDDEPMRVLLVDAHAVRRQALTRELEACGCAVLTVDSTTAGLSAYRSAAPDVVLLGGNSEDVAEFCAAIDSLREGPTAPVVRVVGAEDEHAHLNGRGEGTVDFLTWPGERYLLQARLENARASHTRNESLSRLRQGLVLAERLGRLGHWELDVERRIHCTAACARILGLSAGDDAQAGVHRLEDLCERMPAGQKEAFEEWIELALAGKSIAPFEHVVVLNGGNERIVRHDAEGMRTAAGRGLSCVVAEVSGVRALGLAATRQGDLDALTGLPSRQRFLAQVEHALAESPKHGRHVAVLCVDLNQFKALSGVLNGESTSRLLIEISRRLREGVRDYDFVGRLGCRRSDVSIARTSGDEFQVLLPDLGVTADAQKVGKRILDILADPFSANGQDVFLSVSIGIACHPPDSRGAEELVKCAETAAYCARQQGRNMVLSYSPAMDAKAFERLTLETGLRRALERRELVVHYQPRVEISTSALLGFEALVRWRHPDMGLISPGQFIPLAEETGLIVPIGEWVLREACEQAMRWRAAGLPPVRMAVNLSPVQFRQPDLFESVMQILEGSGLDARSLELELTEGLLMQNPESAVQTLQRFSQRGIHLSIDDFGTGYSSLSYLKRFPIHTLKIDQSFIRELTSNPDDAAIVTSVILMGRSLKLRVVAEGVETRSQLSFLRVMQCHEAQGYLFSPPVPASEAELMVRQGKLLLEAA